MLFALTKSATGAALDLSEYALLFFGLMLVIGIFGEYKTLPKRFLKYPKELFEILVMIGVAGELFGDGGVFLFSRRLQILEGADMQALDIKAEKAFSDATEASHKAKAASDEADAAKAESDKAKDSAGTAESLARDTRQEADAFEKRLASAEAKADRLIKRFADRSIDLSALTGAVQKFNGQHFRVTTYWGNREPNGVYRQLLGPLLAAGWIVDDWNHPGILGPGISGIEVYLHLNAAYGARDAASTLVSALKLQGLGADLKMQNDPENTTLDKNRIEIQIGTKE